MSRASPLLKLFINRQPLSKAKQTINLQTNKLVCVNYQFKKNYKIRGIHFFECSFPKILKIENVIRQRILIRFESYLYLIIESQSALFTEFRRGHTFLFPENLGKITGRGKTGSVTNER